MRWYWRQELFDAALIFGIIPDKGNASKRKLDELLKRRVVSWQVKRHKLGTAQPAQVCFTLRKRVKP